MGSRDPRLGPDYYQHTAAQAEALLARRTIPAFAVAVAPTTPAPVLDGREQALSWARSERASLLACLDHAVATSQHVRVIALTGLAGLLRHDGPWAEALTRHATALRAARQLDDQLAQANVLTDVGRFRVLTDDFEGAAQDLEEALGIYRTAGSQLGQANVLNNLGDMRRLIGDYPAAAGDLEAALGLYRDLGNRLGQANVLTNLGIMRRLTGDYEAAAVNLEEALGLYRDLGDHPGQTMALNNLGLTRRGTRDFAGAARDLEEALSIYREIGNRSAEAEALNEAGTLYLMRDQLDQAKRYHQQALDLAARSASPGTRRTRGRALAAARCGPGTRPGRRPSCGRRWRSSAGSARPRPPA